MIKFLKNTGEILELKKKVTELEKDRTLLFNAVKSLNSQIESIASARNTFEEEINLVTAITTTMVNFVTRWTSSRPVAEEDKAKMSTELIHCIQYKFTALSIVHNVIKGNLDINEILEKSQFDDTMKQCVLELYHSAKITKNN